MAQSEKKLSHASLQQAANWYVLLHDENSTAQQRDQWQLWLDQHGDHQDAWRYVERVGQRFAPLQAEGERDSASRMLRHSEPGRFSRRQGLKSLMVLGAGSMLGWSAWRSTPLPRLVGSWTADFATRTGETRETVLADGTRLWLSAISAVDADFSAEQRLLRLHFGEVLIDTAKDPRPFLIDSAQGRMRALGTRFGVKQMDDLTRLNVYQGAVEVSTRESGKIEVIDAGHQVDFTRLAITQPGPAQTAGESWVNQVLIAENMPLGQLLDELSRYRHGYLGCDPAVASLPVVGAFPLDDTDQALLLLSAALPVRVQRLMPWWVSVEPA